MPRLSSLSECAGEEASARKIQFNIVSPVKSQTWGSERIAEQSVEELETELKTTHI